MQFFLISSNKNFKQCKASCQISFAKITRFTMFIVDYLCSWFVSVSNYGFRNRAGHCKISKVCFGGLDTTLFLPEFRVPLFCVLPCPLLFLYTTILYHIPASSSCLSGICNWGTSLKIPFPGGTSFYAHVQPNLSRIEARRKSLFMESLRKCPLDYRWVASFVWYR